ncbi:pseudaminic acid cytidylyltransferase [Pelagibacterium lentulum]|uniref:Pseudaminic acid cytidylyltransferase n=1 Tax=Pelagibacterium lentulum TaxID=2029865 RepID=A0A916R883_9HYPH|nr:pseudaminic acid cytidylyltransferase [Pelagibacterium lentulum]GGA40931.1 pseudaminic acid cytidylyltransferase [Pelagibacterium lentulum]
MRLAVIPARGGSKRIPRKNIRTFCGKPMIGWSIETARQSECFDRIVVSTDDEEIAEIARSYDAEVPFLRPAQLSDDHTGTIPVIAHAIEWYSEHGLAPEQVCCIYATAPFMTADDLRKALDMLIQDDCEYVFPVASYGFPIQRAIRLTENGRAEMFYPEQFSTRSQDLEEAFHDAGQFYWGCSTAWAEGKPIFSADAVPLILPRHRVQDIDTPEDWSRAELMFEAFRRQ